MSDPFLKIERAWVEAQIKQLGELLEKQQTTDMTQHLRGQIASYRKILREADGPPQLPPPAERVARLY